MTIVMEAPVVRINRHKKVENPRVKDILLFIHSFKEKNDYSPSFREIGEAVGINSTSVTNYYLLRLRTQDYLDFNPRESRTVRLAAKGKEYVNNLTLPKRRKSDAPHVYFIEHVTDNQVRLTPKP